MEDKKTSKGKSPYYWIRAHTCGQPPTTHLFGTGFPIPLSLIELTADINNGTMKKGKNTENLFKVHDCKNIWHSNLKMILILLSGK